MLDEYLVNYGLVPGNLGMNYFNKNRLAKYVKALQNTGFDFHIHAIGDRGVREALDAIEAGQVDQNSPRRHRLTHVEIIHPDDMQRFQQLDIPADCQVKALSNQIE
jgi:predicted amidohydrolase YtcJ